MSLNKTRRKSKDAESPRKYIKREENDSEDTSFAESMEDIEKGEEGRRIRAERLAQLRREQTERAEEEAHKKDDSILEFEKEILSKSGSSAFAINRTFAIDDEVAEQDAHQRTKEGCTQKKVFKYLVVAIGWCDLVFSIMTIIQIQMHEIVLENILRDKIYNCIEFNNSVSTYMRLLSMFHCITSLLLMYSLSTRDAFIMLLWFFSKSVTMMTVAFREFFDLRLQEDQRLLQPKKIGFTMFEISLCCVECGIVIILYLIYTKPNVMRRRKLQSNRPLNRDIYLKGLSPFMQRKYAVRWAERLQACIVLQRIRDRDKKKSKRKQKGLPTDEDLAAEVELGILAFRKANNFDITDIGDVESRATLWKSRKTVSNVSKRAKRDP